MVKQGESLDERRRNETRWGSSARVVVLCFKCDIAFDPAGEG